MANIRLTDGRVVDMMDISYEPGSFSFTLVQPGLVEDVTNRVSVTDKQRFSGFSLSGYNDYLYRQRYSATHGGQSAPQVGSTSTLVNFADQLFHDPLSAPLESLDKGVGKLAGSSGIQTLVILGVVAVGAYIFFGLKK